MEYKLDDELLENIRNFRMFMNRIPDSAYDGKLETAKRLADEFTERTGVVAMVVMLDNKYDWVSEHYFKTYNYEGEIYYETKVEGGDERGAEYENPGGE
jgi:hypothetical protein